LQFFAEKVNTPNAASLLLYIQQTGQCKGKPYYAMYPISAIRFWSYLQLMGFCHVDELIHLGSRPKIGSRAMCKRPDFPLDNDISEKENNKS
jgi:hypothetical protein